MNWIAKHQRDNLRRLLDPELDEILDDMLFWELLAELGEVPG